MEMQLNRFLYTLLILLFVSCKGDAQNNKPKISNYNISVSQIDFLNSKYKNGYQLNIDGSERSDHPFYAYIDCENEGYFAVHYVPKSAMLEDYWEKTFFEENKYEYDDLTTENKLINQKLSGKLSDYNIFSYSVDSKNLEQSNNCTEESVALKNNAKAKIYLYDQKSQKWKLLNEINTKLLPPFANNEFFRSNFPDEFKSETNNDQTLSGFYNLDSATITLNKNSYKIIVLEKNEKKNLDNAQHNALPIIIKKQDGTIYSKNDNLIFKLNDNCPADGFQRLVAKNNFFTIEQTYCKDFMFVTSYATFKINENNEIVLSKYGEEYTDRSNPDKQIKNLIKTTKDFGKIKFQDVNEKMLLDF